jgi:hypothetical protein
LTCVFLAALRPRENYPMRTCSLFCLPITGDDAPLQKLAANAVFPNKKSDRRKRRYLCPVFWGIMYRYVFFRSESGLIFYWKQQALPLRQSCAVRPCAWSAKGQFSTSSNRLRKTQVKA